MLNGLGFAAVGPYSAKRGMAAPAANIPTAILFRNAADNFKLSFLPALPILAPLVLLSLFRNSRRSRAAVQCPHDPDPRQHRRPAVRRDQDQGLHRGLPLWCRVFRLRQFGDVVAGILERDELAPRGSGIGSSNARFQPRSATSSLVGQLPARIEVRSDVGTLGAASPTNKSLFKVGEPDMIGPLVRADRDRMAAAKVRAIDQEAANAAEGDVLRAGEGGHGPSKRGLSGQAINLRGKRGRSRATFGCIR